MSFAIALLATVGLAGATPMASSICVYNDAAFVLKWHLHDTDANVDGSETPAYPVWTTKCLAIREAGFDAVAAGTSFAPIVKAVWGKEITVDDNVMFDPINASVVTYVCTGTTLSFHCEQRVPPPTIGNVTAAIEKFLVGFVEGLGAEARLHA